MAAHTALAKQFGVTEELLDALYHIDTHSHLFTGSELAALRFAEIMTTGARDVDESLRDEKELGTYLHSQGDKKLTLSRRFEENARQDASNREYDLNQAKMLDYQH